MTSNHAVLDGLATLSPGELREAKARLQVLLGASGGIIDQVPGEDDDRGLVYHELCDMIRRKTGAKPPPLARFLDTKYAPAFRSGADEIIRYAVEHLKPRGRAGMIQAIRLLVSLIVRQVMLENRVPIAIGPLACNLGRVAELVDEAFPGYMESGLLGMVLKPRTAC